MKTKLTIEHRQALSQDPKRFPGCQHPDVRKLYMRSPRKGESNAAWIPVAAVCIDPGCESLTWNPDVARAIAEHGAAAVQVPAKQQRKPRKSRNTRPMAA